MLISPIARIEKAHCLQAGGPEPIERGWETAGKEIYLETEKQISPVVFRSVSLLYWNRSFPSFES